MRFQETQRRLTMIDEGFAEGQVCWLTVAPAAGLIRQRVVDLVVPRPSVGWRCDHSK